MISVVRIDLEAARDYVAPATYKMYASPIEYFLLSDQYLAQHLSTES